MEKNLTKNRGGKERKTLKFSYSVKRKKLDMVYKKKQREEEDIILERLSRKKNGFTCKLKRKDRTMN